MEEKGTVRQLNLIIIGLQEVGQEGSDWDLVKTLFTDTLKIKGSNIDVIYRLGKEGTAGPRPTLVRFKHLADRNKIWFAKSKLKLEKGNRIYLQEDIAKSIREAQRILYPTFRKAKSMGGAFKSVQLKGTKLILDGKAFGVKDRDNLPEALKPANIATVQSEYVVVFFGKASPLSNHHPSTFHIDGQQFESIEQFLAWHKAKIVGRKSLASKALKTTNPVACKNILNELKTSNSTQWEESVQDIILTGLRAKFKQNPHLAEFLKNTHPKEIGEASTNTRWGVGLPLNNEKVMDPTNWIDGGNLLGRSLSMVREELLADLLSSA